MTMANTINPNTLALTKYPLTGENSLFFVTFLIKIKKEPRHNVSHKAKGHRTCKNQQSIIDKSY